MITEEQLIEMCLWSYQEGWKDAAKTITDIKPETQFMAETFRRILKAHQEKQKAMDKFKEQIK